MSFKLITPKSNILVALVGCGYEFDKFSALPDERVKIFRRELDAILQTDSTSQLQKLEDDFESFYSFDELESYSDEELNPIPGFFDNDVDYVHQSYGCRLSNAGRQLPNNGNGALSIHFYNSGPVAEPSKYNGTYKGEVAKEWLRSFEYYMTRIRFRTVRRRRYAFRMYLNDGSNFWLR